MFSIITIKDRTMEKFSTGFQSLREVKSLMTKILNCTPPRRNKILGMHLPRGKVYIMNTEVLPKSSLAATKVSVCSPLVSVYRERKCSAWQEGAKSLQRRLEGGVKGQALLSHTLCSLRWLYECQRTWLLLSRLLPFDSKVLYFPVFVLQQLQKHFHNFFLTVFI